MLEHVYTELQPEVGHVGFHDVVARGAAIPEVVAHPVLLEGPGEPGDEAAVARNLAEVARREAPDLRGNAVLLYQGLLREVDLQGVVCGERDLQALAEEIGEGVLAVVQEERVVRERGHGDTDL